MDEFIIDKPSIFSYNDVCYAAVAKLADALDSGSSARKGMEVQVLSAAPIDIKDLRAFFFDFVDFSEPNIVNRKSTK